MKTSAVKSYIFKCLIAVFLITCIAVISEAQRKPNTSEKSHFKTSDMTNSPVIVIATYQIKEGQIKTVLNIVRELVRKTRAEKGNLFYKVHQSNSDVNTIIFYEGYKDEPALEEHRNSEHYQTLIKGQILPLLENRDVVLAKELFGNN